MLNVKKLLTKITERFAKPIGDAETATFPFTATKSGMCCAVITPPTSSASYVYVTEGGGIHWRGSSTGSQQYTMSFPVIKGKTYAIAASANYSINNGVRIYPVMGGGSQ